MRIDTENNAAATTPMSVSKCGIVMKHGVAIARLIITAPAVGSNSFTVAYSGDYNYAGQTSSPLSETEKAGSGGA